MAFDLKQVAKYYKEDMELNFALEEENNRIRFYMDTEAMKEVRFMAYKENPHTMLFLTYLPMKVPEDKRVAVAEYLTRANYGLHVGNFEMDMEDGEVRYKTTGCADENTMPGLDVIRRLTYVGFSMFDRYVPSLLSILYGGKTPTEAIAEAEKDLEQARRAYDEEVRGYNALVTSFPGNKIGGMRYRPRMSVRARRDGNGAGRELPWTRF